MRRFPILLAIIAIGSLICSGQDKPSAPKNQVIPKDDPAAWKEFSSSEGGFSVLLPGTPIQRIDQVDTRRGKISIVGYVLKTDGAVYFASYSDFVMNSGNPEDAKRLLDGGRQGMLSDPSVKLISEKEITLGDNLGREWLTEQANQISLRRAYFVRGRLYQLAIEIPSELAFKTDSASPKPEDRSNFLEISSSRFLNSFKLIKPVSEPIGEVDRMLLELKEQNQRVLVVSGADPSGGRQITSGVLNGRALHLESPIYPVIARAAHVSGKVSVLVLIDLNGRVAAAQVEDGHPLLQGAAVKAARESTFTPTHLDGKPVRVMGLIIYNFVAQ